MKKILFPIVLLLSGTFLFAQTDHHRQTDSYYDAKGNPEYTRVQWGRKSLPADYDKTIRTKYHTSHYKVAKIDRPNNNSIFELVLNIGKKTKTVYTDDQGNQVKFKRLGGNYSRRCYIIRNITPFFIIYNTGLCKSPSKLIASLSSELVRIALAVILKL